MPVAEGKVLRMLAAQCTTACTSVGTAVHNSMLPEADTECRILVLFPLEVVVVVVAPVDIAVEKRLVITEKVVARDQCMHARSLQRTTARSAHCYCTMIGTMASRYRRKFAPVARTARCMQVGTPADIVVAVAVLVALAVASIPACSAACILRCKCCSTVFPVVEPLWLLFGVFAAARIVVRTLAGKLKSKPPECMMLHIPVGTVVRTAFVQPLQLDVVAV